MMDKYWFYSRRVLVFMSPWAGLLHCLFYHWLSWFDRVALLTFLHIFLVFLEFGVSLGFSSGSPRIASPSLSWWIKKTCSSLPLKLKNMLSAPMRKWIFLVSMYILAFASLKNGHPRMRCIPRSPSMSRTTKFARIYEFLILTKRFSTIPSGCRMVESTSCRNIRVDERAGYCSCSNITLGMMLTLASRSQRTWSKWQS